MLFNSLEFIFVFLPATWLGFHFLVRRSVNGGILFLALASLAFYAWWNYRFVVLLLASVVFNFCCGLALNSGRLGGVTVNRRAVLIAGLAVNLGALAYYKYANFFIDTLRATTSLDLPLIDVILPLGISFFTFTQMAFLVDVYRGFAAEYRFANYLLFVTYFPHLIAGPILHHKEMMPQFETAGRRHLSSGLIAMGLTIFAIGLVKKVLIADPLSTVATPVFELAKHASVSFLDAWTGALAYTLQLYFDFSGYCDMAIGLSLLFGIKLPINFDSPYKARSIIDFWRRWHITLSRFLRDYLYIPLGGNRLGPARRHLNLAVTMLLGGLWHGASWTFVVWGGLHGLFLVVNHAWRALPLASKLRGRRWWSLAALAITLLAVIAAWVFFRAETFGSAWRILAGMSGASGIVIPVRVREVLPVLEGIVPIMQGWGVPIAWGPIISARVLETALWIPLLLIAVLVLPNTQQLFGAREVALPTNAPEGGYDKTRSVLAWRPTRTWAVASALLAVSAILALHRASEFLYYQF